MPLRGQTRRHPGHRGRVVGVDVGREDGRTTAAPALGEQVVEVDDAGRGGPARDEGHAAARAEQQGGAVDVGPAEGRSRGARGRGRGGQGGHDVGDRGVREERLVGTVGGVPEREAAVGERSRHDDVLDRRVTPGPGSAELDRAAVDGEARDRHRAGDRRRRGRRLDADPGDPAPVGAGHGGLLVAHDAVVRKDADRDGVDGPVRADDPNSQRQRRGRRPDRGRHHVERRRIEVVRHVGTGEDQRRHGRRREPVPGQRADVHSWPQGDPTEGARDDADRRGPLPARCDEGDGRDVVAGGVDGPDRLGHRGEVPGAQREDGGRTHLGGRSSGPVARADGERIGRDDGDAEGDGDHGDEPAGRPAPAGRESRGAGGRTAALQQPPSSDRQQRRQDACGDDPHGQGEQGRRELADRTLDRTGHQGDEGRRGRRDEHRLEHAEADSGAPRRDAADEVGHRVPAHPPDREDGQPDHEEQAGHEGHHRRHRHFERGVGREDRVAGHGRQTDGQQRPQGSAEDDRRERLREQQPASPARPTASEAGDGDLAAALVGGGDEDEPEDADEQESHLRHEERHGDRRLLTAHPGLVGDGRQTAPHRDRLGRVAGGPLDPHGVLDEPGDGRPDRPDLVDAHPVGEEGEVQAVDRLEPRRRGSLRRGHRVGQCLERGEHGVEAELLCGRAGQAVAEPVRAVDLVVDPDDPERRARRPLEGADRAVELPHLDGGPDRRSRRP